MNTLLLKINIMALYDDVLELQLAIEMVGEGACEIPATRKALIDHCKVIIEMITL